jgi:AP2 domain-containing protein
MPKRRMPRHSVTQPLDKSYRLIPLTQGQNAIVDANDFEWLSQWNWYAVWCEHSRSFYATRNEEGRTGNAIFMHKAILSCERREQGDHKNHDTLDNRKGNLRKATNTENNFNKGPQSNNKSGYKGVSWDKEKEKWLAQIVHQGTHVFIGRFSSVKEAAHAYDTAAKKYHGEFAVLNLHP